MGFLALVFLWLLVPVVFVYLFILPLKLMIRGLSDLIYLPLQLLTIAFNRPLRKNHALEHATINVLESRYGARNLSGLARPDGFLIRGWSDRVSLEMALREAITRLRAKETHLAIHGRCGTSRAAGNILIALLFVVAFVAGGRLDLHTLIVGGLFLMLISPYVGILAQRRLTTAGDIDDVVITGITPVYDRRPGLFGLGFLLFPQAPGAYFIGTRVRRWR